MIIVFFLIPPETHLTFYAWFLEMFMFKVLSKQSIILVFYLMDHREKQWIQLWEAVIDFFLTDMNFFPRIE